MEDDLDDERAIELSSIAAIFPELVLDPSDPFTATLELPITPITPLRIHFRPAADSLPPSLPTPPTSTDRESEKDPPSKAVLQSLPLTVDQHDLSHLPPLSLHITLPKDYPQTKPPQVTLSVTPSWISKQRTKSLTHDCERLWEELGRDQVLYTYIDHLQQAAENAFGLGTEKDSAVPLSGDMKLELLDFDLKAKQDLFERGTFDCGVCLEPKKGTVCHKLLLCGHVFCVACLKDFYSNCISEGDVDNVKCLAPSCGKVKSSTMAANVQPFKRRRQDRTLNPSELLQIPIDEELVRRYVRLKRKKALEADKNTVYCPRQWCQGAAKSKKHPKTGDFTIDFAESDSETEEVAEIQPENDKKSKKKPKEVPMSERLAVCEDCNYAFCCICKKGWHGVLADCNPRRQTELDAEERASMAYLQKYATPCPTCNAPCQKTMGCNHMICFRCKTHFCYLCTAYLNPDNPYSHFNDLKSTCYMRLWELEAGDGEGVNPNALWQPEAEPGWDDDESDSGSDAGTDVSDDFGAMEADEEENTDEEEPAPDQRRAGHNMHIEIVNFARDGANRRIALPQQPAQHHPPQAPAPPRGNQNRRRGQGQLGNRQRMRQNEPHVHVHVHVQHRNAIPPPAPQPPPVHHQDPQDLGDLLHRIAAERAVEPEMIRVRAAPGQENIFAAGQPAPLRAMGLERFLQLAQQDQEDEWDSDELDDDIALGALNLHAEPRRNVPGPAQQRVQRQGQGQRNANANARVRGR